MPFQDAELPVTNASLTQRLVLCDTHSTDGQTGSGKTHTMFGPDLDSLALSSASSASTHVASEGLLPRSLELLFSEVARDQRRTDGRVRYEVKCR